MSITPIPHASRYFDIWHAKSSIYRLLAEKLSVMAVPHPCRLYATIVPCPHLAKILCYLTREPQNSYLLWRNLFDYPYLSLGTGDLDEHNSGYHICDIQTCRSVSLRSGVPKIFGAYPLVYVFLSSAVLRILYWIVYQTIANTWMSYTHSTKIFRLGSLIEIHCYRQHYNNGFHPRGIDKTLYGIRYRIERIVYRAYTTITAHVSELGQCLQ